MKSTPNNNNMVGSKGLLLVVCFLLQAVIGANAGGSDSDSHDAVFEQTESEIYAVLFPWFVQIIGVASYYVISRYAHFIPSTAAMFVVGALIGFAVPRIEAENDITSSAATWIGMEGKVLLLVFFPGLMFLEAYSVDFVLFVEAFWQIIWLAFPMVLAGTILTALVANFMFDYGWSFDLCMTFGGILSATDPVAISILMKELGAPARLQMHIAGESIMNDGSASVFYAIFGLRFLYEMGIPGVGEDVGWLEGLEIFFRLSLGGACIGIIFGFGALIMTYNLDRRLSGEDSLYQAVATISIAYLSFFTAEILAHCSGFLAVVFCGVTVKAFGETLYNDTPMSVSFWHITEKLLNTLVFALGGCVWGNIISGSGGSGLFRAKDWGYLFALFLILNGLRLVLVFSFYPLLSRIGLGTHWREALFMSYSGLRGTVGIALSLALHLDVARYTSSGEVSDEIRNEYRQYSAQVFGMIGGVAFLTLVINGPTSGFLLKKLGLIRPTDTRDKHIKNCREHMILFTLKEFVALLTEERFDDVDFVVVKAHIPFLKDVNYDKLMAAVKNHKEFSPLSSYVPPNLQNVVPHLSKSNGGSNAELGQAQVNVLSRLSRQRQLSMRNLKNIRQNTGLSLGGSEMNADDDIREKRIAFIKILRTVYLRLVDQGELDARGFLVYSLCRSADSAEISAMQGFPLDDWNLLQKASDSWVRSADSIVRRLIHLKRLIRDFNQNFRKDCFHIEQIIAYMYAHELARKAFKREFIKAEQVTLTEAEKVVLYESEQQVKLAEEELSKFDIMHVKTVRSHYACQILLNRAAYCYKDQLNHGLITEMEAGTLLEEIEGHISNLLECRETVHDQKDDGSKSERPRCGIKTIFKMPTLLRTSQMQKKNSVVSMKSVTDQARSTDGSTPAMAVAPNEDV